MKLSLDTKKTRIFIGSKPEVRPVFGWTDGKKDERQSIDETTGLSLWNVDGELIQGDEVESLRIKIASADEPKISARTEYGVNGEILATHYLPNGSTRVAMSILVRGSLVVPGSAPKLG